MDLFGLYGKNIEEKDNIKKYTDERKEIVKSQSIKYSWTEKRLIKLISKGIKEAASEGKYSYTFYYDEYTNKEIISVIIFFREKGYDAWRDVNIWTGQKWICVSWRGNNE